MHLAPCVVRVPKNIANDKKGADIFGDQGNRGDRESSKNGSKNYSDRVTQFHVIVPTLDFKSNSSQNLVFHKVTLFAPWWENPN